MKIDLSLCYQVESVDSSYSAIANKAFNRKPRKARRELIPFQVSLDRWVTAYSAVKVHLTAETALNPAVYRGGSTLENWPELW